MLNLDPPITFFLKVDSFSSLSMSEGATFDHVLEELFANDPIKGFSRPSLKASWRCGIKEVGDGAKAAVRCPMGNQRQISGKRNRVTGTK